MTERIVAAGAVEGLEAELVVPEITRAMFVRYAGASGDFNPIHWDENFAKSAGYPGVFAQGMFTAGVLARFLTDWMGAESVRKYRTRFVGQVWPGDTLTCRGKIVSVTRSDGQTLVECALSVTDGSGGAKIDGSATCVLN